MICVIAHLRLRNLRTKQARNLKPYRPKRHEALHFTSLNDRKVRLPSLTWRVRISDHLHAPPIRSPSETLCVRGGMGGWLLQRFSQPIYLVGKTLKCKTKISICKSLLSRWYVSLSISLNCRLMRPRDSSRWIRSRTLGSSSRRQTAG